MGGFGCHWAFLKGRASLIWQREENLCLSRINHSALQETKLLSHTFSITSSNSALPWEWKQAVFPFFSSPEKWIFFLSMGAGLGKSSSFKHSGSSSYIGTEESNKKEILLTLPHPLEEHSGAK